ncbi:MAG: hypothetical protein ACYDA2_00970 [Acidimicrobiales bacterium]
MAAGRRMLVVGAPSGVGSALARRAAASGATVAIAARRRELLRGVADAQGVSILDEVSGAELASAAQQALGGVDTFVVIAAAPPADSAASPADSAAPPADSAAPPADSAAPPADSAAPPADTAAEGDDDAATLDQLTGALDVLRGAQTRPTLVLVTWHSGTTGPERGTPAGDLVARLRAEEPWLRVVSVTVTGSSPGAAWDPDVAERADLSEADEVAGPLYGAEELAAVILHVIDSSETDEDGGADDVVVIEEDAPPG